MGVFSELDLENQQAEMEKTASESSEIQTLQAKLIQQHEQKKAAAAAEVTSKEPVAELGAKRKQSRKILRQRKQNDAASTRKRKPSGKRNGIGSRRKSTLLNRLRLQKLSR